MENDSQTYEQGYERGYTMALCTPIMSDELTKYSSLESDFHFGILDGVEHAHRDQENERLHELEETRFDPELESEIER